MTLASIANPILVPMPGPTSLISTVTLNVSGERLANVIQIQKAGAIRNVWFRTATVTEEDVLKVSLQGVNASGDPDGTILGAGNAGYVACTIADTDDTKWCGPFQLGADVTVTQGQYISVVMEWNSYADGDLQIAGSTINVPGPISSYSLTDIGSPPSGSWTKGTGSYCIALEYDDGTYVNYSGCGFATTVSTSSASNPDEIGNYVTHAFPFRAIGFWVYIDADYDFTLSLLSAAGTTLANATLDSSSRYGNAVGYHEVFFDADPASTVSIAKDTYYRVVITPGADAITIRYFEVPEAAAMSAFSLGTSCVYTAQVDGGGYSQTDTRRAIVGLLADQLDDGATAGGGGRPEFRGSNL